MINNERVVWRWKNCWWQVSVKHKIITHNLCETTKLCVRCRLGPELWSRPTCVAAEGWNCSANSKYFAAASCSRCSSAPCLGPWFWQGSCSVNDSRSVTIGKDALHDWRMKVCFCCTVRTYDYTGWREVHPTGKKETWELLTVFFDFHGWCFLFYSTYKK
jgi:hypothetical protein